MAQIHETRARASSEDLEAFREEGKVSTDMCPSKWNDARNLITLKI